MQRLMKRTAQAVKQVERRNRKKERMRIGQLKAQTIREQKEYLGELKQDIKEARLVRREKWEQGPNAPRRDVLATYGALETNRSARQSRLRDEMIEARCAWAGGASQLGLRVGDRVVMIEGPEKGKIDKITNINMETATVQLESLGRVSIAVPEPFQKVLEAPPTQNSPVNIPISAVRLVHPIPDPQTGVPRDVIIRRLEVTPAHRVVAGENIVIPYPKVEEEEKLAFPVDTRAKEVDEHTFRPTLFRPPMPSAVIDELRNKYSRFRTRHDDDYVARKEEEEAHEKALKKMTPEQQAQFRTPVQEFNRQLREARRARGQPELSDDMLAKIGEVIAKNKSRTLNAAGISEVSSAPTPKIVDAAIPSSAPTKTQPPLQ
ncbi:KOW domain-containing protein domain-containing protein [Colletotrichum musicola]|uniref:KOW domain-containing protein domain-containing protein n=1 Tax=Colletotrichum musicola TaxID=2175873 RepID=A0A8H6NYC5_9PEZI|nr:KOW domain-containing protein domain-containing protein [Colletotrichum musicola]